MIHRFARVKSYAPKHAEIIDERWVAMPPTWVLLAISFAAFLLIIIGYSALISTAHRRADMDYNNNGELVEVDNDHSNTTQKMKKRLNALHWIFTGFLVLGCIYGLSNSAGNTVARMRLHDLRPVPATLMNCTHHYHGSQKGHDQIECNFRYAWNGQTYTGIAEAIDFRNFPTDGRMDTAAKATEGKSVIAYIAPNHPAYAWSFISTAWFVPYSWGLFELMEWLILLLSVPVAMIYLSPTKSIKLNWWSYYAASKYTRTVAVKEDRYKQGPSE